MVRKLTVLLLCLMMLGSHASAQIADYTGVWYLVSVESNGVVLNPSDIGMEMSINISADSTATITSTGEEDKLATWTLDGDTLTITSEGQPLAFKLSDDGHLSGEDENSKLIFGREAPAPGFVPAAEIAAPDIAAFNGTWTITTVNIDGMNVPFSAMAQAGLEDASVVIQDGSVTSLGMQETGTFSEGKLEVASLVEGMAGKTFALLEDGTLSMTFMEIIFYCVRTEPIV